MKTFIMVIGVVIAIIAIGLLFVYFNNKNLNNNMDNKQRATELADKKIYEDMKIERSNVAQVQAIDKSNDKWEIVYDLKTVDPYSRIRANVDLSTGEVSVEKVEK